MRRNELALVSEKNYVREFLGEAFSKRELKESYYYVFDNNYVIDYSQDLRTTHAIRLKSNSLKPYYISEIIGSIDE